MNQLFLTVLVLPIILKVVAGGAVVPCDKLKDSKFSANNIYLVVLKDNHTEEDANRIIEAVNKYQSSLEENGTEDTQPQIRSQLTYLRHVNQLIGPLSVEAVLLVCTYIYTFLLLYIHSYVCTYALSLSTRSAIYRMRECLSCFLTK